MTLGRRLIHALDRPPTRSLLAGLVTCYARRLAGSHVRVFFDDVWVRQIGADYFADGPRFAQAATDIQRWSDTWSRRLRTVRDFWFHAYEPRPGDVLVDVGAGLGVDTFVFSRAVGNTGRVLAIEAHPTTFRSLRKLCQLNKLTNVIPVHVAVTDRPTTVSIQDLENSEANWIDLTARPDRADLAVEGLPLDDICRRNGISRIDFLKMNIEGAEGPALDGMVETLRNTRHLCIACHDFRAERGESAWFRTRQKVADALTAAGFEIATRPDDRRAYVRDHVYAHRSAAGRREGAPRPPG